MDASWIYWLFLLWDHVLVIKELVADWLNIFANNSYSGLVEEQLMNDTEARICKCPRKTTTPPPRTHARTHTHTRSRSRLRMQNNNNPTLFVFCMTRTVLCFLTSDYTCGATICTAVDPSKRWSDKSCALIHGPVTGVRIWFLDFGIKL